MVINKEIMGLEDGLSYLNHASIGPLPRSSFEILHQESKKQMLVGEKKIYYEDIEELWDNLRRNAGKLINGSPEGVTITTNTASGLHIVADCLYSRFVKGKNIILPDTEFVTNSYCWQQVAARYKIELRQISLEEQTSNENILEDSIDDNTVLVALSHVQFSNGFRSDLQNISKMAHSHGALVCVDAIQSIGAVPFDVKKFDVDFVAAAGYKWMLGPLGSGLFYMKPELVEELDSVLVGWFSTPNFRDLMHNIFTPWQDARKFQQSMINPVLNAFNESMNQVLSWDPEKTFKHIITLQNRLIEGILGNSNYSIGSSLAANQRSGILKINCIGDSRELIEYLGSKNITVSYRDGGIRVSPHAYNDFEDIDRLVAELVAWNFE